MMVQLTSLLLLVVASCSTFSSVKTATTTTGQKVAYNKFKTSGGGGKTDLEKARKFIKVFESRVNRWSSILKANNSGVDGTSVRLSQSNLARIKALTEAELKVDKDSRTLDHIEKDLVTEAEDKTKNVTSETLAGDWMRNRLIADILDRLRSYMKSSEKVVLDKPSLKSGKKIHPEMDDYVNDGEEGGEFGKDDCEEEEEFDDPATPTLSTKAKQSPSAKGKVQLGVRQQTQPGLVHQVVKKDEVSYPLSKVSTDKVANEPIPRKAVKHSNGRDRPLANTSMVPAIATTVSSLQNATPKTILDDPAISRAVVQNASAAGESRTTKRTPQFFTLGATFLTIGVMLTGSVVCSIVYFALTYQCRQKPIRLPTFLTLFASRTSTSMRFYRLKDDDTSVAKAPENQEAA